MNVLHILWLVSHKLQCNCVYSLNFHALVNGLIDNTNKCTGVKIYTFTYSLKHSRHALISYHPQGVLHQPSMYKTDELSNRLKF